MKLTVHSLNICFICYTALKEFDEMRKKHHINLEKIQEETKLREETEEQLQLVQDELEKLKESK
jgi:phosphopantothenate synthetase